jgi:hypothetical protein
LYQIAEPPILTSRTIELFREAISPEAYQFLCSRLEQVKTVCSDFLLYKSGRTIDEAYELTISRYFYRRLELVVFLISTLNTVQFAGLIDAVNNFAFDSLKREGWKLGGNVKLLENAWLHYKQIITEIFSNLQALTKVLSPPYNFLTVSTKMDFCLSSTLMFLEGEFPDADNRALGFLCEEAQRNTLIMRTLFHDMISPRRIENGEKVQALRKLFGSWNDDPELDRLLAEIYQSRD